MNTCGVSSGAVLIGPRYCPATHDIRTFLAANLVNCNTMECNENPDADVLLYQHGFSIDDTPVVVLKDKALSKPSLIVLANLIGLNTKPSYSEYDLAIIGAGPAGLAAGVYGGSEGLRTLIIDRKAAGGQAGTSSKIENYLGFPGGLSGAELSCLAVTQCKKFGVELINPQEVSAINHDGPYHGLVLGDGTDIKAKTILLATGVDYRRLQAPGVMELTGAGVYYGTSMADAVQHKGEDVFIVGGANSAGQAAMCFAEHARKVTMVIRANDLGKGMSQYLVDRILNASNIEVLLNSNVVAAEGEDKLEYLLVEDATKDTVIKAPARAMYLFIGAQPNTDWLPRGVMRDDYGFILSGRDLPHPLSGRSAMMLETSKAGVFVAGDARYGSVKRVASSSGEGAMAVSLVHQRLAEVR